ncbi:L-seryl-tRNA(Ser) seleniumtransferase [Alkalibacillus flavidus]|uniref:L-seryl-tRNA(Sec) selenium transferase n=1 Tax=Alkalibacillus flavidus TaxID=546021 RepID=A0ABV2KRM4_9BACI
MNLLRAIPAINRLIHDKRIQETINRYHIPMMTVKDVFRRVTDEMRDVILRDEAPSNWTVDTMFDETIQRGLHELVDEQRQRLQPVINGTGTVIHTNLGRSKLAHSAVERVRMVTDSYSTLEYDLTYGARGSRHDLVEERIKALTGAEAAIVVNNNAAAVYMVLSAFAKGYEVIVSRGELIEIGGSFRVSRIMEESGAKLREVGTTNKTHASDYESAIQDDTAMIMKVHTSNFTMQGFTASVDRETVSQLAKTQSVISYEDLGSGSLIDLSQYGISQEPSVNQVIHSGVDIVSFSVDKLLGGPQAGIIAGKKKYIDQLKRHQLARVLRVDKMTYAALDETLRLMQTDEWHQIPTLHTIFKDEFTIEEAVNTVITKLPHLIDLSVAIEKTNSQVGGGTLPDVTLPSYSLAVQSHSLSSERLAERLRKNTPAIIARVENDTVWLDFRTIDDHEHAMIIDVLADIDQSINFTS